MFLLELKKSLFVWPLYLFPFAMHLLCLLPRLSPRNRQRRRRKTKLYDKRDAIQQSTFLSRATHLFSCIEFLVLFVFVLYLMSKIVCVTELSISDCPFVFLQYLYIIQQLQIIIIICHILLLCCPGLYYLFQPLWEIHICVYKFNNKKGYEDTKG